MSLDESCKGGWTPAAEGFAAGASSPSAPGVGSCRCQLARQRVLARQQPERDGNLPTARHAELLTQHVAMSLSRSRGDAEGNTDLVIRQPLCDQFDDLPLPRSDP
jgi:hypothetical protein